MIIFKNKVNRFIIFFFRNYFRLLFRKYFFRINLKGWEILEKNIELSKNSNVPLVFIFNHSNWWDAAFVVHFSYNFIKMNGYCLMEYKQMRNFRFFNKIGAIPIIRENARYSLRNLNFITESIKDKSKIAVVFPQAELVHNSKKPYKFYSGFENIIKKLGDSILICGYLDYRFTNEQRPELFINIFESYIFSGVFYLNKNEFIKSIERKYELINLEFEKDYINGNLNSYQVILQGRKSISS